jgi:UDP-glucose 4-epimerase
MRAVKVGGAIVCRSRQTLDVMRILVTGSSGRVGRAIYVRPYRDHKVVALDRSPWSTADVFGNVDDVAAPRRAACHELDVWLSPTSIQAFHA